MDKSVPAPIFKTSSVDPSLESPIKMFLVFTSKSPPSCGLVSATKSVFTVSKLGSAPLFARRNLPSLDPVPCSSFANVTAVSCILPVVTASSANSL